MADDEFLEIVDRNGNVIGTAPRSVVHSNPALYECIHNGPFCFNRTEIDDLMFWGMDEVRMTLGKSIFSKNFESEMTRYLCTGKHIIK